MALTIKDFREGNPEDPNDVVTLPVVLDALVSYRRPELYEARDLKGIGELDPEVLLAELLQEPQEGNVPAVARV